MNNIEAILAELKKCDFKVSTDTRQNLIGTLFFALKGESFDGNKFIKEALDKGAIAVVSEDENNNYENVYIVKNVLKTLQEVASIYRKTFSIPMLAIGGSNGKTTSKELVRQVLKTKYMVHSTEGSLNNHIGVPLSILSMDRRTEIGIFEVGANHLEEHTELLKILYPTHVVVTNNGMDHLEGFGSPEGVRRGNAEIYDWAEENNAKVFVNKNHLDLMKDSKKNERILYPEKTLSVLENNPLTIGFDGMKYQTKMAGGYNVENVELAIAFGNQFEIDTESALDAICKYSPNSRRSQFLQKNNVNFIVDCYNANPSSMRASLESFIKNDVLRRGVILGDMLELGNYATDEHKKIVDFVLNQKNDIVVFVGENFKNVIKEEGKSKWFPDSQSAREWFWLQDFTGYTFLLKGSRGMKIEKIIE